MKEYGEGVVKQIDEVGEHFGGREVFWSLLSVVFSQKRGIPLKSDDEVEYHFDDGKILVKGDKENIVLDMENVVVAWLMNNLEEAKEKDDGFEWWVNLCLFSFIYDKLNSLRIFSEFGKLLEGVEVDDVDYIG